MWVLGIKLGSLQVSALQLSYRIFKAIELQDVGAREECLRTLCMFLMGIVYLLASLFVCLFLDVMRCQTLLTGAPGCDLLLYRLNGADRPFTKASKTTGQNQPALISSSLKYFATLLEI